MMELPRKITRFFEKQGFVIVSTLDTKGKIHCSAKGIVGIEDGKIFLIDVYLRTTFRNLKKNKTISITAVDEHNFEGYTLQGSAKLVAREDMHDHIVAAWEKKIVERISKRIIKSVQTETKSQAHFEAELPSKPTYVIEVDVENIIDLSPPSKKG
ncbi:MAG: pyridoxamine 5'-phosphate oxidase family protein [Candidatus Omnitrophica bacterium]|nr:pyridoxamine 5'-phosphate oxidase family protein [Candidatus Omnitrophota bacterium]